MKKLRIGTRSSILALKQTDIVKGLLNLHYPSTKIEITHITTTGDKILDKNLANIGGKGLFIKEIEEKLEDQSIDIAVHSMKDMPAYMPEGFSIACILEREDARDVFISAKYKSINDLPNGAVIGTSSSRRAAQVLNIRPDLKITPFRGNINTRLKKVENGEVDATFLAIAGLKRANLIPKDTELLSMYPLPYSTMLPAVSQGAIGVETLSKNVEIIKLLQKLNHKETSTCITAERAFMQAFEGSCTTPIAANAEIKNNHIHLTALIARPNGTEIHKTSINGKKEEAEEIGHKAALDLKSRIKDDFFS